MPNKIVLYLLCAGLVYSQQTCDYSKGPAVCDGQSVSIRWKCPVGFNIRVKGFWGRVDNSTCTKDVPRTEVQDTTCSGNEADVATKVSEQCKSNAVGGWCDIQATSSSIGRDPCSGTRKYLRVCTFCEPVLCDYSTPQPTCQWKMKSLDWNCPENQKPKVNAFWGRVPGDNTTCVDQVPHQYLENLSCPGDDRLASQAVQKWCNENAEDGRCRIKASVTTLDSEPCLGTFKYLRACTVCQGIGPKTLLLLDCTGSMAMFSTSYMPLLIDFLDKFLIFTSTDGFWADHMTYLEIIPFTTQLDTALKVTIDYSDYASARSFREADIEHVNEFKNQLENNAPRSITNLGQVMHNIKTLYTADEVHLVILLSDFINIETSPDMVASATDLKDEGIKLFPVLLDKPQVDSTAYEQVRLATVDQVGIKISNGSPIPFHTIFDELDQQDAKNVPVTG